MMNKSEIIKQIIELQRSVDRARREFELDVWMGLTLTIAQLKSLFFISNRAGTSLGKLAAALRVTPTNTTGIVDRLVKQGLVSRDENPEDRRVLIIQTTEAGEALINQLREKRVAGMSKMLEQMSLDELLLVRRALALLEKAAST